MISAEEFGTTAPNAEVDATSQQPYKAMERAKKELRRRRRQEATFTTPLQKTPETKPFLNEFYKNVHTPAKKEFYRHERSVYESVGEYYRKLCGRTVSFEDFWSRYEYRCDLQRILEEQKTSGDGEGAGRDPKYGTSPTDVKEDQLFRDGDIVVTAPIDENKDPKSSIKPLLDGGNNADSSSSEGSRANQAFKRRKSRLAKLVAAKKELRKAKQQIKVREQKEQTKTDDLEENDRALASVKEESVQANDRQTDRSETSKPSHLLVRDSGEGKETVSGVPRVDIQDVYRDEDAAKNVAGKTDKCECTACTIM
jgi:hypothetical protein